MNSSNSINAAITRLYPELSPSARVIANYIQAHPLAILSMSMNDIAIATATSKATVSRFFRQIGYDSHQQVKAELHHLRQSGLPVAPVDAPNQNDLAQEIERLTKTIHDIPAQQLAQIVSLIATSPKISIVGFRNSYPVALHFRQQLKQIRASVRILPQPGQTLAEELVDLAPDELIILVGFRRRPKGFRQLVESIAGQPTILLTDPSGQVFNQQVDHLLVCHLGQENAFDSYAAPMSVLSMICNHVYQTLKDQGGESRIEGISTLYKQLDELSDL